MKWIAVVVIWGTTQWGIIEATGENAMAECQRKVEEATPKGAPLEICQPVGPNENITPEELELMKTYKVLWE